MNSRGVIIDVTTRLVTEECCNCHVLFAFPDELKTELLRARKTRSFYCPNGHPQCYVGESEEARLQRELEEARAKIERVERQKLSLSQAADQDRAAIRDLSNQVRGQKAAKTRLLRRVTNGVCPCCQRTFANVSRHMQTRHPDQVVSAADAVSA